jgi:hypothetical protein
VKKYCASCLIEKDLDQFYKDRSKDDYLTMRCIPCFRTGKKLSPLLGPRRPPKKGGPPRKYVRKNELVATYAVYRSLAINVYGGCCAWCKGVSELQFDHVDGNGNSHRKKESHKEMYKRIARTGVLKDYRIQLLCKYCHKSKTTLGTALDALSRRGVDALSVTRECLRAWPSSAL